MTVPTVRQEGLRPGGWGWMTTGGRCDWGSEPDTTQHELELTAVRELLRAHPQEPMLIRANSYVINVFTEWLPQWRRQNMRTSSGKRVKNQYLIEKIDHLLTGRVIEWRRVRRPSGHALDGPADHLASSGVTTAWAYGSWPRAGWLGGGWPKDRLTAATDGSSLGSPGPGGWGWTTISGQCDWGSETNTTHNRMELTAVRELLRAHPEGPLLIQADSTYVIKMLAKNGKPVKNQNLISEIKALLAERDIEWDWVRGHSGHALNETADRLAGHGARTAEVEAK